MNDRYIIPSLDRSFYVLELLAESGGGASLADLSRATQIPKSTLFRILITLEKHRCVRLDAHGRYRLGSRLWELGGHFLDHFDLFHVAADHMARLADLSGETVFLGMMDEGEVLYVRRMESKNSVSVVKRLGQRVPMHATATGMAMLAFLPDAESEAIIKSHGLTAHNESTVTDVDELKSRLARIRKRGFAIVDGEYERELLCVSAPVFDHTGRPAASMTVALLGANARDNQIVLNKVGEQVREEAILLSREMGAESRARLMQLD